MLFKHRLYFVRMKIQHFRTLELILGRELTKLIVGSGLYPFFCVTESNCMNSLLILLIRTIVLISICKGTYVWFAPFRLISIRQIHK